MRASARCRALLPRARSARCLPRAGVVCGTCIRASAALRRDDRGLHSYAFPTDRLLQRIKYGGRIALAEWAGAALASRCAFARRNGAPATRPDRIVALPLADRAAARARFQPGAGNRDSCRKAHSDCRSRRRSSAIAAGPPQTTLPVGATRAQCPGRIRGVVERARSAHRARRRRHDHRRHARRGLAHARRRRRASASNAGSSRARCRPETNRGSADDCRTGHPGIRRRPRASGNSAQHG